MSPIEAKLFFSYVLLTVAVGSLTVSVRNVLTGRMLARRTWIYREARQTEFDTWILITIISSLALIVVAIIALLEIYSGNDIAHLSGPWMKWFTIAVSIPTGLQFIYGVLGIAVDVFSALLRSFLKK
jgi:hypothetical protein